MLFNSVAFAIFLPIIFILYWTCPAKFRCFYLLCVSYWFYMNIDVKYPALLFYITAASYGLALCLDACSPLRLRKTVFITGLLAIAAPLFFFKYYAALFPGRAASIQFMLPVGISFYTFQALGYFIDIYRRKYPAERHFGHYCLFICFFPQLLSGPIGRGDGLLPQWKQEHPFDAAQVSYGLKLMAVGYFRKLVVAGLLAPAVDAVYDNPGSYTGLIFPVATLFFAIQIYCDFSGYTDIAIGCAKLFGINLPDNFKSPYFSRSIREFWGRWHISLSTWFRDYVYIPLGGSRAGRFRRALNLMLTFLASALWHGAGATYLAWGALHGLYRILENLFYNISEKRNRKHGKKQNKVRNKIWDNIWDKANTAARYFLTFTAICFAWIFFRADSLSDAWRIISLSFRGITDFYNYLKTAVIFLDMDYGYMLYLCLPLLFLAVYDYASMKMDVIGYISSRKGWIRYPLYILFLLAILLFSEKGVSTEFYYFKF